MSNSLVKIIINDFVFSAEIFSDPVGNRFLQNLPYTIEVTLWGGEAYGELGVDLGRYKPVPAIPPGGLAWSKKGGYFCLFFGQTPAWPVDYFGQIKGEDWEKLKGLNFNTLKVRRG